jgi:hypothetical protein
MRNNTPIRRQATLRSWDLRGGVRRGAALKSPLLSSISSTGIAQRDFSRRDPWVIYDARPCPQSHVTEPMLRARSLVAPSLSREGQSMRRERMRAYLLAMQSSWSGDKSFGFLVGLFGAACVAIALSLFVAAVCGINSMTAWLHLM